MNSDVLLRDITHIASCGLAPDRCDRCRGRTLHAAVKDAAHKIEVEDRAAQFRHQMLLAQMAAMVGSSRGFD